LLAWLLALAVSQNAPALAQDPKADARSSPAPGLAAADARAEAYYYFTLGHVYERLFEMDYERGGRNDYASQAIANYKKAYDLDPSSDVIGERLAEMYAKTQRIREAVLEAQEVLKRDPNRIAARRLLARIYLRTLGEMGGETRQRETAARAIEQFREILRIDPADTEAALWLSRLYRVQNEHDQAAAVLRAALARQPASEPLLEQMAQLLLDQGQPGEAVALLEKAGITASSADLSSLLGQALAQQEQYDGAAKAFRRAIELDPDQLEHRRGLARVLLSGGKEEAALEQFRQLAEREPGNAENYLRMAQSYRHLRRLEQAEESILRARQLAPGSTEVVYTESLIYESQGRYEDAIRVLSGAVASLKQRAAQGRERNRRSLGVLYEQLGRLYREAENFPAAIATFQEMMALGQQESQVARGNLIETYRAGKQLDLALDESKKSLDADPRDRGAKLTHALLLAEKGEGDQAAALLRSLLAGNRDDREVYLTLAQAFERGRRFAEAEQAVRQAEKLSERPGEREMAWFLLGAIYERQKKFELAESEFRKVLEVNPRNAGALNYYGYMLADRGVRLEEAAALVKRALEEDPHNGAYLDSLGWAYYKQGKLNDAVEYLRRAVERSRFDPTIRDHLGDAYLKLGRADLAAAEWERSLEEWRRSLPSEFEADKAAAVEGKLRQVKPRVAQKPGTDPKP
jgi:tetratricopeptide (TPR) repeat protein